MQTIPLQSQPSQILKAVLGGQNCQIFVYQKPQGVYVDVVANGIDIVIGVIAEDANIIICREYIGFQGNLMFIDTQGSADPDYLGMGSRWQLVYLTAEENALLNAEAA